MIIKMLNGKVDFGNGIIVDSVDAITILIDTCNAMGKDIAASRDSRILSAVPSFEAWPPIDVIKKLVEAVDILLYQKDYDAHGWELIATANDKAKEFLIKRGIAG